jgi:hypothetical protein
MGFRQPISMVAAKKISFFSLSRRVSGQHPIVPVAHPDNTTRLGPIWVVVGQFFVAAATITVDNFAINGVAARARRSLVPATTMPGETATKRGAAPAHAADKKAGATAHQAGCQTLSQRRCQQYKTNGVSNQAWCQQQGASESQQQAFNDFLTGQLTTGHSLICPAQRAKTLNSKDIDADERGHDDQTQGRQTANQVGYLKQQQQLGNGYDYKGQ